MTPQDARLAVKHGVGGVVICNHGGSGVAGRERFQKLLPVFNVVT